MPDMSNLDLPGSTLDPPDKPLRGKRPVGAVIAPVLEAAGKKLPYRDIPG